MVKATVPDPQFPSFPGLSTEDVDRILGGLGVTKTYGQNGEAILGIHVVDSSTPNSKPLEVQFHAPSKTWRLSPPTTSTSSSPVHDGLTDPNRMTMESPVPDNDPFQLAPKPSLMDEEEREQHSFASEPGISGDPVLRPNGDWTDHLAPLTDHVQFFRNYDWAATPLGPLRTWSVTLQLMTKKLFTDPRAACIYWGLEKIAIYNESFVPLVSQIHPMLMGCPYRVAFSSTWGAIQHIFENAEHTGVAAHIPTMELALERDGYLEETYFDVAVIPLRGEAGLIEGFYNSVYEITRQKLTDRRSSMLNKIAATPDFSKMSVWQHIRQALETLERDIPMAILYSAEDDLQTKRCVLRLEASIGIRPGHPAAPAEVELHEHADGFNPYFREARVKDGIVVVEKLPSFLGEDMEWRGFGTPSTTIIVLPFPNGPEAIAFLALGLNPRRAYDKDYQQFVKDLTLIISTSLKTSIGFVEMRARELQLSKELSETEKFVREMAELAPVGMFNLNANGVVTWANAKFYEVTGLSTKPEENYELSFLDCFLEDDRKDAVAEWERARLQKSSSSSQLRMKRTWSPPAVDDTEKPLTPEHAWVLSNVLPVLENSAVKGVMGCVTDISQLKWAESVQANAARVAQEAKTQQEKFVDITSHEIRNPLSAVVQCADSILTSIRDRGNVETGIHVNALLEEIVDSAQTIVSLTAHQHRIVDDILTISKLESGMLPLALVAADTSKIMRDTVKMFEAELEACKIELALDYDPSFDKLHARHVYCDPSRIRQILINLLTNAIKFTKNAPRREISISVAASAIEPSSDPEAGHQLFPSKLKRRNLAASAVSDHGGLVYISFSVKDTGKGIKEEEMTRLFKRFTQANIKTHIKYGGSGLGLFISRELTEMHGGLIGARSMPGEGSCFVFYIMASRIIVSPEPDPLQPTGLTLRDRQPALQPRSPTPNNLDPPSRKSSSHRNALHILLVEDNILNQKVLSKQLVKAGCTVHVANHGGEAIDFLPRTRLWSNKRSPDPHEDDAGLLELTVILMDWEMPVMDGIASSKRIRELEREGSMTGRLLIVGTTANARDAQIKAAMDAGMDDVVTKPFTVPDLMERIETLVDRSVKAAL